MKYLFLTNDVGYQDNANSNIVFAICDELHRGQNEIHIFSVSQFTDKKQCNYRQYPVFFYGPQRKVCQYSNQYHGFRDICKLIPLLFKPFLWHAAFRVLIRKVNAEKSESIESFFAAYSIRFMNKKQKYDRIIAVCEPGMSMHIAARLRHPHISIYQLDPFHSGTTRQLALRNWRLCVEKCAYRSAEKIYLTKLIGSEYINTILAEYHKKWAIVEFPLIRQHIKAAGNPSLWFDDSKINCLYCGALDMDYRNPKFTFDLARDLGDDYRFYFIGVNCVEIIRNASEFTDNRIMSSNPLPVDEIYQLMDSADFLVNIGNTMTNQMPSKIIDYISTGKPIINIVKSRECPTLEYTARYPLCINVLEETHVNTSAHKAVDEFCRKNRGKSTPFSEIKQLYYEATPEYVARLMEQSTAPVERGKRS